MTTTGATPTPAQASGAFLAELRIRRGARPGANPADWTMAAVATACGISAGTLHNIEAGRALLPRVNTIALLLDYLSASTGERARYELLVVAGGRGR